MKKTSKYIASSLGFLVAYVLLNIIVSTIYALLYYSSAMYADYSMGHSVFTGSIPIIIASIVPMIVYAFGERGSYKEFEDLTEYDLTYHPFLVGPLCSTLSGVLIGLSFHIFKDTQVSGCMVFTNYFGEDLIDTADALFKGINPFGIQPAIIISGILLVLNPLTGIVAILTGIGNMELMIFTSFIGPVVIFSLHSILTKNKFGKNKVELKCSELEGNGSSEKAKRYKKLSSIYNKLRIFVMLFFTRIAGLALGVLISIKIL